MFINIAVNKSFVFIWFLKKISFIFQNFTSDIGKILELQDVENGLDDYRSTAYLSFEQYRYYLFKEVFSALPDEMSIQDTLKVSEKLKVSENSLKIKLKSFIFFKKNDQKRKSISTIPEYRHQYSDFRIIFFFES